MKTLKLATSVAAMTLLLGGAAFAQSFTLNGTEVPEDQVAKIQAHCDTLMTEEGVSAEGTAATGDSASGAAAGTTGNGSLTDSSNEAGSTGASTSTDANTNVNTDTGAGTETDASAGAAASAGVDFATLDLTTIDLAACQAGGFSAMSSQ